ncbi:MAG: hypothetical protein ACRDVE_14510 [Actinocrinis sp.]
MTPEEIGKLLATCAAFDNRKTDDSAVLAWLGAVGDLSHPECEAAVIAHYSDSREWIMPADVRSRVRRKRRVAADHGRIRELLDLDAYRREVDQADKAFMRKLAERTGGKQLKAADNAG